MKLPISSTTSLPIVLLSAFGLFALVGCGSGFVKAPAATEDSPEALTIAGPSSVICGQTATFTATSNLSSSFAPEWTVQGGGSISAQGVYAAATCPAQGTVTLTATDPSTSKSTSTSLAITTPEALTIAGPSSVICGQTVTFTATSSRSSSFAPVWTVQGGGSISAQGVYTAATCPAQGTINLTATDPSTSKSISTTIDILNPLSIAAISPSSFTPGTSVHGVVKGSGFTPASVVTFAGVALPTAFVSSQNLTFQLSSVPTSISAATLEVSNGANQVTSVQVSVGISYDAAARFLQQASWGATPALVAHVQQVGFQGYLKEQFASAEDSYTNPDLQWVPQMFWWAASLHEQSQLRTKIGWAWYKLFNSPGTTVAGMFSAVPNLTNREAFGSFADLLTDVTTNVEMGFYFNYCCWDVAQSVSGAQPDENYARELMQQFSIGPYMLNADGTYQVDQSGQPVPAYSQVDVRTLARTMTGLTYNGNPWTSSDPEGLVPMVSGPQADHDSGEKQLLGQDIPGGMDAITEIKLVVNQLASNPNTGRHMSKYLIHELVTSNPSPDYVARVAGVWANDGSNNQGNIQAVITAILLDPEARAGDDPTSSTPDNLIRFRDDVNWETNVLRQFGATPRSGIPLMGPALVTSQLAHEAVFAAPSVFGYYSDYSTISGSTLLAPEAQIYTSDAILQRAQFAAYVFGLPGVALPTPSSVDWTAWEPLAQADGAPLLDAWNHLCFHGKMSSALRAVLSNNLQSVPSDDLQTRVQQTAYLIVMSPEYMTEY